MRWLRKDKSPLVKQLQILKLEPGDSLLITTDRNITTEEARRIKDSAQMVLDGVPILVASPDLEFKILRRDHAHSETG